METGSFKEYFHIVLIILTIPVYWLVNLLLRKLKLQSPKWRAVIAFFITMFLIIVIGFAVVLKEFILFHSIPGG